MDSCTAQSVVAGGGPSPHWGSAGGSQAEAPGSVAGSASVSPDSYLCFESSKSGSSKRNKVIKLVDITDIQKVGAALPPLSRPP